MQSPSGESVRIDKWLWAARFFKTRTLAAAAVNGGKVHLNGARVKPSRGVKPGDRLAILRGEDRYEVEIVQLSERRGPATAAQALYAEDEAARQARENRAQERRFERAGAVAPAQRPDKHARRRIRQLRGHD